MPGSNSGNAQLGGNATRHDVIEIVRRILPTPGIVSPVENRRLVSPVGVTLDEDRAMIAAPRVVRRIVVEEDATPVRAFRGERAHGLGPQGRTRHVDVDLFMIGEVAGETSEDSRHRPELPGPGRLLMRPAEPGAAMGLPFGGHAVTHLRGKQA